MDITDDSEDYGPTAAKRMRVSVAEVSIEEVQAEVVLETEQHAKVTITPIPDALAEDKPINGSCMDEEDSGLAEEGRVSKKKKKNKNELLWAATASEGILPCQAPGCEQRFVSVVDHDIHYNARHRHVCSECKKPLASPHLLELHVLENHDAFFAILAERKPMYSCLEEFCTQKFSNSEERIEHCVSQHQFSKTYRIGSKPKAFKQDSKDVVVKVVHAHKDNSNSGPQEPTTSATNEALVNKKKHKSSSIIKDGHSVATHITFGRHGVRFIPRQVFAMPKKSSKPCKISAPNNSTEEMTDLSDLQDALQGTSSSSLIINDISQPSRSNGVGDVEIELVDGMEL